MMARTRPGWSPVLGVFLIYLVSGCSSGSSSFETGGQGGAGPQSSPQISQYEATALAEGTTQFAASSITDGVTQTLDLSSPSLTALASMPALTFDLHSCMQGMSDTQICKNGGTAVVSDDCTFLPEPETDPQFQVEGTITYHDCQSDEMTLNGTVQFSLLLKPGMDCVLHPSAETCSDIGVVLDMTSGPDLALILDGSPTPITLKAHFEGTWSSSNGLDGIFTIDDFSLEVFDCKTTSDPDTGESIVDCQDITDSDGDGVPDLLDNCPDLPNPDQTFKPCASCPPLPDFCASKIDCTNFVDACHGLRDSLDAAGGDLECDRSLGKCLFAVSNIPGCAEGCSEAACNCEGDSCYPCPGVFEHCLTDAPEHPPHDYDCDGLRDDQDSCPTLADQSDGDRDEDGVGDLCDNCPLTANHDQKDSVGDGIGDACRNDLDADGICDTVGGSHLNCQLFGNHADNCPDAYNPRQTDTDGDGIGETCDNCPLVPNTDQADTNGDGFGDACSNECTSGAKVCGKSSDSCHVVIKEICCTNGTDDDSDQLTDCDDPDCANDPTCIPQSCTAGGNPCSSDAECCSGTCIFGKGGNSCAPVL
jgi:thrombospondin type 3 repeat protein